MCPSPGPMILRTSDLAAILLSYNVWGVSRSSPTDHHDQWPSRSVTFETRTYKLRKVHSFFHQRVFLEPRAWGDSLGLNSPNVALGQAGRSWFLLSFLFSSLDLNDNSFFLNSHMTRGFQCHILIIFAPILLSQKFNNTVRLHIRVSCMVCLMVEFIILCKRSTRLLPDEGKPFL